MVLYDVRGKSLVYNPMVQNFTEGLRDRSKELSSLRPEAFVYPRALPRYSWKSCDSGFSEW